MEGTAEGGAQAPARKEFLIVPPGPINKSRRVMVARFLQSHPDFASSEARWRMRPEVPKQTDAAARRTITSSSIKGKDNNLPKSWVLERKPGEISHKGAAEPVTALSGAQNYFVLVRSGKHMMALPADQIVAFRPPPRRGDLTLEEAEERMRAAKRDSGPLGGAGAGGSAMELRMMPKSVREAVEAVQEAARAKGKGQEALAALDEADRRRMAALFGEDDDDATDLGIALPGRAHRGAGGRGRGRKGGAAGRRAGADVGLDDDELAEDIYEGEDLRDELRPEKPEPAEDWEHEDYNADDDLDQGEKEGEKEADDPGERRKLGIEAEEDEEEEDEETKRLKRRLEQDEEEEEEGEGEEEGAAGEEEPASQATGGASARGGSSTRDGDDGDEDEDLDLDEMASTLVDAPGSKAAAAKAAAPAAVAGAKRKAADSAGEAVKRQRMPTPPPSAAAPAAAAGAAVKREPTPPAAAAAPRPAAAAASSGVAVKREPTPPAAAAGAAPAAAAATARGAAGGAAGCPSSDEIKGVISKHGGKVLLNELKAIFKARVHGPALDQFKKELMKVAKFEKDASGAQYIVLR